MNNVVFYSLVACVAGATYLTRFPPLLLSRIIRITPRVRQGLRYIPIGVFSAMVAPAIAYHPLQAGQLDLPFYGAAAVALFVATITKHPLWTMLAGVAAAALLRLI